jgi:hypothetical protein
MPLTARENQLRDIARRLIESDHCLLSNHPVCPMAMVTVSQCSLCNLPIGNTEVEYELESAGKAYHFHFMRHAAWAFECARATYLRQLSTDRSDDG